MQHSEISGAFMDNEPLLSDHLWSSVCAWVSSCAPVTNAHKKIDASSVLLSCKQWLSLKAIFITSSVELQVSVACSYQRANT